MTGHLFTILVVILSSLSLTNLLLVFQYQGNRDHAGHGFQRTSSAYDTDTTFQSRETAVGSMALESDWAELPPTITRSENTQENNESFGVIQRVDANLIEPAQQVLTSSDDYEYDGQESLELQDQLASQDDFYFGDNYSEEDYSDEYYYYEEQSDIEEEGEYYYEEDEGFREEGEYDAEFGRTSDELNNTASAFVQCDDAWSMDRSMPTQTLGVINQYVPAGSEVHCAFQQRMLSDELEADFVLVVYGSKLGCPSDCYANNLCAIADDEGIHLYSVSWHQSEYPPSLYRICSNMDYEPDGSTLMHCENHAPGFYHPIVFSKDFKRYNEQFRFCFRSLV